MAGDNEELDLDSGDRGDDFVGSEDDAEVVEIKVETPVAETKTEEKTESEKTAEKTEEEQPKTEEQPRDATGKFTSNTPMIPKARVDEMVKTERERVENLERQNQQLQEQLKQATLTKEVQTLEDQVVGWEAEHAKAVLDGNTELIAELAGKIRNNERLIQNSRNEELSTRAKNELREEIRMDMVLDNLEVTYPMLKTGSENFDEDAVELVLAQQRVNIERFRMSPSEALEKAAEKIMPKLYPVAAEKEEIKEDKPELKDAKQDTRKQTQLDKNMETIKKQPADLKSVGADSDKKGVDGQVDPSKLSYEEFSSLPESTIERLRGDHEFA